MMMKSRSFALSKSIQARFNSISKVSLVHKPYALYPNDILSSRTFYSSNIFKIHKFTQNPRQMEKGTAIKQQIPKSTLLRLGVSLHSMGGKVTSDRQG